MSACDLLRFPDIEDDDILVIQTQAQLDDTRPLTSFDILKVKNMMYNERITHIEAIHILNLAIAGMISYMEAVDMIRGKLEIPVDTKHPQPPQPPRVIRLD